MPGKGEGRLLPSAETQADPSTAFPCLLVIMQPSTLGGICRPVKQDLHTEHVTIKGQGFFHIPGANGDVRYGSGFHRLHSSKARRLVWYGVLGRMITGCNDASSRTRLAQCQCHCREA